MADWGDFNLILNAKEKWGKGNLNMLENEFKDCLHKIEVADLSFSGCPFTWCNKQADSDFVGKS